MSRSICIYIGNALGIGHWIGSQTSMQRNPKLLAQRISGFNGNPAYFSSISIDSSLKPLQKPKKKSKVLSTNVIHVGEEAVFDKNAKVKRLNASQLHKVEKSLTLKSTEPISKTNKDISLSIIENAEFKELYGDSLYSNTSIEVDAEENFFPIAEMTTKSSKDFAENPLINKKRKKKKKEDKVLKIFDQIRWKGRNQNFNDTLAAFICVCMNTGNENAAFQTFNHYLKVQKKSSSRCITLNSYNEILKGIAVQGDYLKMKETRHHLMKSSLTPNLNTFAQILTCLGKHCELPHIASEIQSTIKLMEEHKIDLNDLFSNGLFSGNSLEYCLKAVQTIYPDIKETLQVFNPTIQTMQDANCYKNPLVDKLNDSLFSTKVNSPAEGVLTQTELADLIEKQIALELKGHVEISSIWKDQRDSKTCSDSSHLFNEWETHWRESLRSSLVKRKEFMKDNFSRRDFKGLEFYPYFVALDDDEIINLLMMEVNKLCMGSDYFSPTLNSLARNLGTDFFNRFLIKYKQKTNLLSSIKEVYEKYCQWYLDRSEPVSSYVSRVQWNKIVLDGIEKSNLRDYPPEWPYTVKSSIGKLLYNIIISSVVIWQPGSDKTQALPAFYKVQRTNDNKVRNEINQSPLLMQVYRNTPQKFLNFSTAALPMVSPSVPWMSIYSGGYFVSRADFVRVVEHAHQQKKRMKEGGMQKLFPIMDSLNQLGSIPWKINHEMLDLLIGVFLNKGWEKMDIAPPCSELTPPPAINASMCSKEKAKIREASKQYKDNKNKLHSLWCSMLYKLSIANHYRDQIIWLPLNMDFRGRTYPIPPHLTHLSSDVFRSFMLFAQGKKLGEGGLSWLKLHLINLTGVKKRCNVQERLDYCEEMMDEIYDSADNPLEGRRWWAESDEPWQTLAACMELAAAMRSGCPEEFVSRLPIHQDGSCNGLQHYAALGRDQAGAESVNLCPSTVPQDVYSNVVALVEEARRKDAEDGLHIAEVLEGVVKRKVIKQTIMTNVYGVTRYGATRQICKQLNYLDDFPSQYRFKGSGYLTKNTFESLGTIFSATKEIQDWFVKIAEGVSKHCVQNVEWVTPLGFPVVQPYSKNFKYSVVAGKVFQSFNYDYFSTPNARKQKNAFPPNFIHSLDSSHMMLTSIFCQHAGISFVSIHDCFWTHAATVPIMNKICREQFVALHSQPILEDIAEFMINKYSQHEHYTFTMIGNDKQRVSLDTLLSSIPKKGDLDIKEVLNSVYFFS